MCFAIIWCRTGRTPSRRFGPLRTLLLVAFLLSGFAAFGQADFDFSPESHQRFYDGIESAQTNRYHEVVAAYETYCNENPGDAQVALERVEFIEFFLYSEDFYIESAEADHELAKSNLETRFSGTPQTRLYKLERAYGEDFFELVEEFAPGVSRWNREQRADYHFLLAQRHSWNGNPVLARDAAEKSFLIRADPATGIVFARALKQLDLEEACLEVLNDVTFDDANIWQKQQKMNLLFELKDSENAIALYHELEASDDITLDFFASARMFVEEGNIDAARGALEKIKISEWNTRRVRKEQFELELEHGSPVQAMVAYRQFRDTGLEADLFLSHRYKLFRKHPALEWQVRDAIGLMLFGLLLLAGFVSPLLFMIPVHYWGLLRIQKGIEPRWTAMSWNLRTAFLITGTLISLQILLTWFATGPELQSFFADDAVEEGSDSRNLIFLQIGMYAIEIVLFLLLLWRGKLFRFLGSGRWTTGQAIGYAVLAGFILRIFAAIHMGLLPDAHYQGAQGSPVTTQLSSALLDHIGPWGLFLVFGLVGPILEELLFRGLLLSAFVKHIPFWAANLLQALLFTAVHEDMSLALFFVAFGLITGLMVRRSNGLLAAILLHVFNNTLVCFGLIALHGG